MRRFNPELWSGVAMLAVMLVAAGPALFGWNPTRIPHALWVGIFIVMLVALYLAGAAHEGSRVQRRYGYLAFAVAVLSSWLLVLSAGAQGLVAILLVVTVALAPYIAPLRLGWGLIAANLLVLVAAFRPWEPRPGLSVELSLLGGFYLLVQSASLLSSAALLREQLARRRLAEAHVELQAATALLAESARTSERLRISRDLHDLIGHQLTVLTLELEAAKHRTNGEAGSAIPHIERADAVARDLLANVRETVGELRGDGGQLRETLQRVVADLPAPRIVLEVDEGIELEEQRTTLVVRAVQEIVTNTIRHARADELWIEVRDTASGVLLRAHDDGIGQRDLVLGNGLRGVRERFEALGGSAVFDGSRGFGVTARLPA